MNEFLGKREYPLKSARLLRDFEHDIVAIVEDSLRSIGKKQQKRNPEAIFYSMT